MTKYFKGNIISASKFPESVFNISFININDTRTFVLDNTSKKAYLYFRRYSSRDLKSVLRDLSNVSTIDANNETKVKCDNLFKDVFKMTADDSTGDNIIYEKIYDEDGNAYAKEIISGEIFPINSKFSDFDIVYEEQPSEKVFFDKKTGKGYRLYRNSNLSFLVDMNDRKHLISDFDFDQLKNSWSDDEKSIFFDSQYIPLTTVYSNNFAITITPKMIFPKNQRIECVVAGETIANDLEVKKYLDRVEIGFGKKRRKKNHTEFISSRSSLNYLGDNIRFVTDKVARTRVSEDHLTKEMEELEFLLSRLKSVSKEEYLKLNNEYSEVLNHGAGLSLNPLSIKTIITLQNKANLAYICHGGDSKRILEYLEKQANIYLDNLKNNTIDKTELSISKIDKICENFLYSKSNYSYNEQNEILRNISLLYFFEIYENRDILTSNDLLNSYILDNIKRIITIVSVLVEEGIIKEISNTIYDISNIDELLEFIKKIEFNSSEEISQIDFSLVKKMQR